ncbi:MAG: right-handed parallel beta-helix repeat-containing protein [Candidatus Poribacteria bacterium]
MKSMRRFALSISHFGKSHLLWLVVLGIFCFANISEGKILHVPSEYDTIQLAINAASDGDFVAVADGIYSGDGNKNIDFLGKAITVRSENGPDNCVIDCEKSGRGFYFHNGEAETSVLKGFTIRNGYVDGSWPQNSGGGIFCDSSSPTIVDNIIIENSALYSGGGIICFESSSPIIENNTITQNTAFLGGGIYCFRSSPMITDNNITLNSTDSHGGGISCSDYSDPIIQNNIITGNSGRLLTGAGGGVECYHYASPTIINNIIARNSASNGGGIFCFDSSYPTILNNTVVRNFSRAGSGIAVGRFSSPTVINTILWNVGDEVRLDAASISITYSNVQGGYEGEGNIDAVPRFLSLREGDYHLRPTSPCIGAGTNVGAPPFDKDGNPRPNPPDSNCDIGAYEHQLGSPRGASLAPQINGKPSSTWGRIKAKS